MFTKLMSGLLVCLLCLNLTSCSREDQLNLSLDLVKEDFKRFDDVVATISLRNAGKEKILINQRLYFQTEPLYPASLIEGLFLITDSKGNQISPQAKTDISLPAESSFAVLAPGDIITRDVRLRNLGFKPDDFDLNEVYTVTVIYQNSLQVLKIIDGEKIYSWVGKTQSNSDSFKILRK